ncbi:MAG TPA: hypothetical protein VGD36_13070 [Xanthobacteraceae bacterium]|jgi:hypothetical protein
MKPAALVLAVIGVVLTASAASAQFGFYIGPHGARFHVGPPRWHYGPVLTEEVIIRRRPRCRVVEEERERADGTVVIRRVRRCR